MQNPFLAFLVSEKLDAKLSDNFKNEKILFSIFSD